jgi:molecular chaperone DnaK
MSKDDIDKAVKEAEAYAAEDKKRREAVDVRNNADQMIYQTEKTVTEFGDKLSEEEKNKIETAKEALKEALKGEDIDAIKARQEELQKEIFAISEKVYKAAAEAQAAAGGNPADANAQPEDNVYEADFTDVDENK